MAQRFHAHVLLAGRLFAAGEPHPEFFSITGVLDRAGRWYSMYPIGGPALLAVGAALHATWLVNPVLTAFTACALYRFAAAAFGEGPGRASALLFALSPFVLIMGASEMNHVGALALATLALAALPTWATAPRGSAVLGAAALIGLGVGGMATIRPLDAAVVAVVIGVFQLSVLRRDQPRGDGKILVAMGFRRSDVRHSASSVIAKSLSSPGDRTNPRRMPPGRRRDHRVRAATGARPASRRAKGLSSCGNR